MRTIDTLPTQGVGNGSVNSATLFLRTPLSSGTPDERVQAFEFSVPMNSSGVLRINASASVDYEELTFLRSMSVAVRNSTLSGLVILDTLVTYQYEDTELSELGIFIEVVDGVLSLSIGGVTKDFSWSFSYDFLYSEFFEAIP